MRFTLDEATLDRLRPRDRITFGNVPVSASRPPPPCPNHYEASNARDAYRRVLWSNPTPQFDRSQDKVGTAGHVERANAWTHLVACVLFVSYSLVRVGTMDHHSLASQLSGVSVTLSAIMFATSVMYHVFGTVPGQASWLRNLDIVAIYMSLGLASDM